MNEQEDGAKKDSAENIAFRGEISQEVQRKIRIQSHPAAAVPQQWVRMRNLNKTIVNLVLHNLIAIVKIWGVKEGNSQGKGL